MIEWTDLFAGRPHYMECRLGTSKKFWQVEVAPGSVTSTTRWGAIGTEGQRQDKTWSTYKSALAYAQSKVNEKVGRGYRQVPWKPKAGESRIRTGANTEKFKEVMVSAAKELGRFMNAASTGVDMSPAFESVDVGLSDEQIVALSAKLAKMPGMGRRSRAVRAVAEPDVTVRCSCGAVLESIGERRAKRCASCLSKALGSEAPSDDTPAKAGRKIRFID